MKLKIGKLAFCAFIIFILNLCAISVVSNFKNPTVNVLSKQGDKTEEVKKIQTALADKGYYCGQVDGVFGDATKEAVTNFQKDNNITADGIAGSKTLELLGVTASNNQNNQTSKYSDADMSLLARIISAEARGEPYSGQVAVGAVVLNRIGHPSFPDTLSGVIYQPGAFSCLTDGQINEPVDESAKRAAQDAMNGTDPSGGAIYYYNPEKTTNSFMLSRPVITVIGKHKFCS
ncbi:MAG: Spore cortex-lytic enzyme [Eubacteriales bacterium SKADARSKE-1]|nr:Spore cortex-lytic enzyme [Eubacteriales bacterium SKADARSKE-1]